MNASQGQYSDDSFDIGDLILGGMVIKPDSQGYCTCAHCIVAREILIF